MLDLIFALKNFVHLVMNLLEKTYGLVGPLAPVLSIIGVMEGVLLAFAITLVVGAHSGLLAPETIRAEGAFMTRMKDANGMLANVAIITGFIGTYVGLMQLLPSLSKIVEGEAGPEVTSSLLAGLSTAFVSSIAGLALGGIVGSVNQFLLGLVTPWKHGQGGQRGGGSSGDGPGKISPSAREAETRDTEARDAPTRDTPSRDATPRDTPAGEEPPHNGRTGKVPSPGGGPPAPKPKDKEG
jgi:hypothetical protein